jgi:glyoxylase-like metal-dependent hydrolase (beta-lactamase superfamily II)
MTATGTVALGNVEITQVSEHSGGMPRDFMFPDADRQLWEDHRDLLVPDFWDPTLDVVLASVRSWVVRSEGTTILVDTGIGNDRDRPGMPDFDHLNTAYLENLAAAGVRPQDVDLVVVTHLHPDHVGWNTQLVDGEWTPSFPNARYLISRADFEYWNPANANQTRIGAMMTNVFEDSVLPVHLAGQTLLWDGSYTVDTNLELEAFPGHTPGSAVLSLRSGSDRAAFVGDLLHTPLQILHPDMCPCLDEDEEAARTSRRRILEWVADNGGLLLPAHFHGAPAAEVRRDGTRFDIIKWAAFR